MIIAGYSFAFLVVEFLNWKKSRDITTRLPDIDSRKTYFAHLAEAVIPESDAPGALQADVASFIVRMLKNNSTHIEVHNFLDGCDDLEDYCKQHFNSSFINCSIAQQQQALDSFEKRDYQWGIFVYKVRKKIFGASFITLLKQWSVWGYCTSELGATLGMAYDPIPIHYESCKSLLPGQRCWATK